MRKILDLLSHFLLGDLSALSKPRGTFYIRWIANLGAFFFLIFGYVLGCRALYHYLEPLWGQVYALLALCALLVGTSLIFFIVGWFLKPKSTSATDFVSAVEKLGGEIASHEIVKNIISKASPKILVAVFTVVAVASYFANFKKKDI